MIIGEQAKQASYSQVCSMRFAIYYSHFFPLTFSEGILSESYNV